MATEIDYEKIAKEAQAYVKGRVDSIETKDFVKFEVGDNYFKIVPFSDGWFREKGTHFFSFGGEPGRPGKPDKNFPPVNCPRICNSHLGLPCPYCEIIDRAKDYLKGESTSAQDANTIRQLGCITADITSARASSKFTANVIMFKLDEDTGVFKAVNRDRPRLADLPFAAYDMIISKMASRSFGVKSILSQQGHMLQLWKPASFVGGKGSNNKYKAEVYAAAHETDLTEAEIAAIYSHPHNISALGAFKVPTAAEVESMKSKAIEWVQRFRVVADMLGKSFNFGTVQPPKSVVFPSEEQEATPVAVSSPDPVVEPVAAVKKSVPVAKVVSKVEAAEAGTPESPDEPQAGDDEEFFVYDAATKKAEVVRFSRLKVYGPKTPARRKSEKGPYRTVGDYLTPVAP